MPSLTKEKNIACIKSLSSLYIGLSGLWKKDAGLQSVKIWQC